MIASSDGARLVGYARVSRKVKIWLYRSMPCETMESQTNSSSPTRHQASNMIDLDSTPALKHFGRGTSYSFGGSTDWVDLSGTWSR